MNYPAKTLEEKTCMKNKDAYHLTDLSLGENFKVDGCGKKIPSSRTVCIKHRGMTIAEVETQESMLFTLMRWLEQENKE